MPLVLSVYGQKYSVEQSLVSFFSDAPVEDIKADNHKATSLLNVSTGEVAISIPLKDFEFAKSLMKEHFNEKYLESDKYPIATFQGKFTNFNLDDSSEQTVTAAGKLTIHGVTREIKVSGTFQLKSNQITAQSKFVIRLEDYKVKIPQILWSNIAEEVEVTITLTYKRL
jgi:polyisoprenoid-binding protein YceI